MELDYDKTYYDDDVLLKDTIPASTTYSSPYLEWRGRSGRTPIPVHLQLGLEAPWVQRYSQDLRD